MLFKGFLLSFFIVGFGFVGFGQGLPTNISQLGYNPQLGKWQVIKEEKFEYDNNQKLAQSIITEYELSDDKLVFKGSSLFKYNEDEQLIYQIDSFLFFQADYYKKEFYYNYENGLLKSEEYYEKRLNKTETILLSQKIYTYNDDELLIQEEKYEANDDDFLVKIEVNEYEYNERGCLIRKANNDIPVVNLNIYERGESCELLSSHNYYKGEQDVTFSLTSKNTREYIILSETREEIDSVFYNQGTDSQPNWNFFSQTHKIFDQYDNRIESTASAFNGIIISKIFREYDSEQRLIYYEENRNSLDSLILRRRIEYDYIFDENNFVTSLVIHTYIPITNVANNTIETFKYKNYCDGTVKMSSDDILHDGTFPTIKTEYRYLDGTDCDFKKEQLPLEIYPNPNNGIFQIKGDLLQGASTKVQILNIVGQLIYEIQIPKQTYVYDLDLSHLNNGQYVLFVQNGEYFSTEQMVIFK